MKNNDMEVVKKRKYINFGFAYGDYPQYYCPRCKCQLGWHLADEEAKQCPRCGQSLKWSLTKT